MPRLRGGRYNQAGSQEFFSPAWGKVRESEVRGKAKLGESTKKIGLITHNGGLRHQVEAKSPSGTGRLKKLNTKRYDVQQNEGKYILR